MLGYRKIFWIAFSKTAKWEVPPSGWSSFLIGRYVAQPPDESSPAQLKDRLDGVLQQEPVCKGELKENIIISKWSGGAVSSVF